LGLESYFSVRFCGVWLQQFSAKSDAAKLQHSFLGLAVEACSEFRKLMSNARLGVRTVAKAESCFGKRGSRARTRLPEGSA